MPQTSRFFVRMSVCAMIALTALSCAEGMHLAPAAIGPALKPKPHDALTRLADHFGATLPSPLEHDGARAARGERFRVAILSDMNSSYGSTHYRPEVHGAVAWLTQSARPSLVLSTGDMVAGMREGLDYEAMWVAFHEAVTHPLTMAGIPFAPTPGNHDASIQPGYEYERREYDAQWKLWKPALDFVDTRHYPRRYAFLHGGALFISLDATTVGRLSRAQLRWLEQVLIAQAEVPVKVVFGHLPIHPFAARREREVLGDVELEALLNAHGVSAYLSGHHHAYYPGKRGKLRMVSMACLGGGARKLMGTAQPSARSVAVLEIDPAQGVLSVEAYSGERFDQRIERESLPERLGAQDAQIWRDDL